MAGSAARYVPLWPGIAEVIKLTVCARELELNRRYTMAASARMVRDGEISRSLARMWPDSWSAWKADGQQ